MLSSFEICHDGLDLHSEHSEAMSDPYNLPYLPIHLKIIFVTYIPDRRLLLPLLHGNWQPFQSHQSSSLCIDNCTTTPLR